MSGESEQSQSTTSEPQAGVTKTQCHACRGEIVEGATICPICKTYQPWLLRWLQQAAAVVTVLAVLGGASVYAITHAPDVRRVLWWRDDIDIVALRSEGSITVANVGDGPVVLHSVVVHAKTEGFALNWYSPLDATVSSGEILHHKLSEGPGPGSYVFRKTYADWMRILTEEARVGNCATVVYFGLNDVFYKEVERQSQAGGPDIRGDATVTWYSARSGRLSSTTIPVAGALYITRDCYTNDGQNQ